MKFDFSKIEAAAKELFTEGGNITEEITALLKAVLAVVLDLVKAEI